MEKLQPPLRRPEAEAVRWAEFGGAVASIVTRDPETGVWRGLHALAASDIGGHWPLSLTASLVTSLGSAWSLLTISGPSSCQSLTESL